MKKTVIIILVLICQVSVFAKSENKLHQKFYGWFQQQKNHYDFEVAQQLAQQAQVSSTLQEAKEQLNVLEATRCSLKTKLPLLQKIHSYEEQLNTIEETIQHKKAQFTHLDLASFIESHDFQSWIKQFEDLSLAEQNAIRQEIQAVGQLKTAWNAFQESLEKQGVSWDAFNQANNWEELLPKATKEEMQQVQQAITTIKETQGQIRNIEITELFAQDETTKLLDIINEQTQLPILKNTPSVIHKGIDVEEVLNRLSDSHKEQVANTIKKYHIKEVKHEEYAAVIFQEKPELKEMLFVEVDMSVLKSDRTVVAASSLLGMQVSKRLAWGVGTSFQNLNGFHEGVNGLWSGRLVTRVNVWKDLVALQVEGLSSLPSFSAQGDAGSWDFSQLIGTRLQLPSNHKIPLTMGLFHQLNPSISNPIATPWQMKLGVLF